MLANILFIGNGLPSIGIAYMASFLKKHNHNVHYFRASLRSMFLPNAEFSIEDHINKQLEAKVDLFCFSVMTVDWQWTKEKVSFLKKRYPEVPILVGGTFAITSPEIILEHPGVDYVCCGDGEEPLLAMANSIDSGRLPTEAREIANICFKENGRPVIKEMTYFVENLDDYPFPDLTIYHGQFPGSFFTFPFLVASRGCPFSCTYCSCPTLKRLYSKVGKFVRRHSVSYIIEYLSNLKKNYRCQCFIFSDDVFSLDKEWLREFAAEYKKKLNIPITCLGNPNCIDKEVAQLFRDLKCKLVVIGLQSGSEEVRRQLKRLESNKKVMEMAEFLKDASVHFSLNHIFDLPFDTEDNIYESARFYNQARPDMIDTFSLVYFPQTEIIEYAASRGYVSKEEKKLIEVGEFSGYINSYKYKKNTNYQRYNLFFNLIPLLPKKFLDFILSSEARFINCAKILSFFPAFFAALVKLILAFRNGTQFIQGNFFDELIFYLKRKLGTLHLSGNHT